ncbi:MAG: NUDIX hydrolase [Propionibacteriaceae bacterium]|nr:NUDIX hydrolase [Propionibacteriaceae bacterium]
MSKKKKVTVAAGTVTLREREGKQPQVLLVHRPAYDDWSLPKGHLEPDEYEAVAAARETWEETGVKVALRHPIGTISYPVGSGTKVVHYWRARPVETSRRKPDKEVDKVAWLTPQRALERMTYPDERRVLTRALELPDTTPFLIVRHAKAMDRKNWSNRDQYRPITSRGRKQSSRLIPLLEAFGVRSLASSTSTRCIQTLAPYGRMARLDVAGWAVLSEEVGEDNPAGVRKLMTQLAREAARSSTATAVCGHRPVLPTMLDAVGVPNRPMQTAATIIAHLDAEGRQVAVEFHRPLC